MNTRWECTECGSIDAVEHVADLAPGQPWFVCRPCLDRFAREALIAELQRRGEDEMVIAALTDDGRQGTSRTGL